MMCGRPDIPARLMARTKGEAAAVPVAKKCENENECEIG